MESSGPLSLMKKFLITFLSRKFIGHYYFFAEAELSWLDAKSRADNNLPCFLQSMVAFLQRKKQHPLSSCKRKTFGPVLMVWFNLSNFISCVGKRLLWSLPFID
jgi:hypothetical protein